MTRFQEEWNQIAAKWGLRVETPFVVKLATRELTVPVLLRDFGARNGMLLVTDFNLISPYTDELVDLGYGFSCLSEPTGVTIRTTRRISWRCSQTGDGLEVIVHPLGINNAQANLTNKPL